MLHTRVSWTAVLLACVLPAVAGAQGVTPPPDEALTSAVAIGDRVSVDMDTKRIRGQVVDLSSTRLTLLVDNVRLDIPTDDVRRVQKRHNRIFWGPVIGAAIGVPSPSL
jgi:hypothetical protein